MRLRGEEFSDKDRLWATACGGLATDYGKQMIITQQNAGFYKIFNIAEVSGDHFC